MRSGAESLTYTDSIPVNPINLHLLDQNHKMQRESKTGRENVYNNGNLQQPDIPVIPAISSDRDSWRCDVQMSDNMIQCLPIRVQTVIHYRIQENNNFQQFNRCYCEQDFRERDMRGDRE